MPTERGRPAPWLALSGTVVWTWLFLGAAVLTGRAWLAFPTVLLTLTGFLGPVVVPSLLIGLGYWPETLGGFWRRCLDPRTLRLRWYAIATGLLLVMVGVPALLSPAVDLRFVEAPLAFLVVGALAGAVEEPGWRGYGLAALQERLPVLVAALVVGVFWALWHLPLFWLEGTYQAGLGVGTPAFWGFLAALLVGSPIYAWLYNASGRVVFSVVWFHAVGNVVAEALVDGSDAVLEVGAEAVVALVLVVLGWRWITRPADALLHLDAATDRGGDGG